MSKIYKNNKQAVSPNFSAAIKEFIMNSKIMTMIQNNKESQKFFEYKFVFNE